MLYSTKCLSDVDTLKNKIPLFRDDIKTWTTASETAVRTFTLLEFSGFEKQLLVIWKLSFKTICVSP